jgi:hypothetical protein
MTDEQLEVQGCEKIGENQRKKGSPRRGMLPDELRYQLSQAMHKATSVYMLVEVDYAPDSSNLKAKLKYYYDDGDHIDRFRVGLAASFSQEMLQDQVRLDMALDACVKSMVKKINEEKLARGIK